MKQCSQTIMLVVTLPVMLVVASIAHAGNIYEVPAITHIAVEAADAGGRMYIKWAGSPRPGPCGTENNGWVVILPTNNEALKSLALSLYFSGKPARIDTSGCSGPWEIVTIIYSPGG
jgi:hypothetical protein